MIPTHVLTDLKPDERVAVLSRGGEIHFHVHPASDEPDAVRAFAAARGVARCWPPTCGTTPRSGRSSRRGSGTSAVRDDART